MSDLYPKVEVSALLIGRGGKLLLDYNQSWSAFCFPITKVRDLPSKIPDGEGQRESALDAAVRAAVEMIGVPLAPDRLPKAIEADIGPYQQSGRDGQWKRYEFHLFGMKLTEEPKPLHGHTAIWLKPEEIRTHQPISPTTLMLLERLDRAVLAKLLA